VITCDPDNEPSRKTCERLGCYFERIADVPEDIYEKFEISREKCRYIWHMAAMDEQ
jgi:RimJ/RimL family protein N-acetyltransferase